MRVIAGQYRGRTLFAPKGSDTRPTTDRVRESLFSALASLRGGLDDAVVLDAFAGTGALGIEALSRGARLAVFCERDRLALQALARNTSFIDDGRARIVRGDVLKRGVASAEAFDMVFLDPPYVLDAGRVAHLLEQVEASGSLAQDAIVAYERSAASPTLLEAPSSLEWHLESTKTYGDTAIDLYRRA